MIKHLAVILFFFQLIIGL